MTSEKKSKKPRDSTTSAPFFTKWPKAVELDDVTRARIEKRIKDKDDFKKYCRDMEKKLIKSGGKKPKAIVRDEEAFTPEGLAKAKKIIEEEFEKTPTAPFIMTKPLKVEVTGKRKFIHPDAEPKKTTHEWSGALLDTHEKVIEVIKKEGKLRTRTVVVDGYSYKLRLQRHKDWDTWNGYVGVEKIHPLYEFSIEQLSDYEVEAHGGLTFAGHGFPRWESKDFMKKWWVWGFDTGHAGDYNPGITSTMSKMGSDHHMDGLKTGAETYRSVGYVMNEVEQLVDQLVKITAVHFPLGTSSGRISGSDMKEGMYSPTFTAGAVKDSPAGTRITSFPAPAYPATSIDDVKRFTELVEESPFDLLTGTARAEALGEINNEGKIIMTSTPGKAGGFYKSMGFAVGKDLEMEASRRTETPWEKDARIKKRDRMTKGMYDEPSPHTMVVDKKIERKAEYAGFEVTKSYADGHKEKYLIGDAEMEKGKYKIDDL